MNVAERITEIDLSTFSTRTQAISDAIFVTLVGNADMDVHDLLKKYLDDLHRTAQAAQIKEAVFDLKELYFMNSSCLSLFLRLLNSLAESNKTHKYSLRFRSNPGLPWQRRSLSAVRKYAQDLVVIE